MLGLGPISGRPIAAIEAPVTGIATVAFSFAVAGTGGQAAEGVAAVVLPPPEVDADASTAIEGVAAVEFPLEVDASASDAVEGAASVALPLELDASASTATDGVATVAFSFAATATAATATEGVATVVLGTTTPAVATAPQPTIIGYAGGWPSATPRPPLLPVAVHIHMVFRGVAPRQRMTVSVEAPAAEVEVEREALPQVAAVVASRAPRPRSTVVATVEDPVPSFALSKCTAPRAGGTVAAFVFRRDWRAGDRLAWRRDWRATG